MTPLPGPLGGGVLIVWRLDELRFASTWDSGEGAFRAGGRWNSKGRRTVYCAVDPATAILEVAAHKGFAALDIVPHVLTSARLEQPELVHVVRPETVPNPNWLRPCTPSAGQQAFGDALLVAHRFVLIPSAVSTKSWNLIFAAEKAAGSYAMLSQERFALDTRLNPTDARHPGQRR